MRTEKEIIAAARQYLNDNKGKVLGFDGDCDATEDDAIQLIDAAELGWEENLHDTEKSLERLQNWKWPLELDSPIDCIKAFGDQPTPKQLARMMVRLGLIEEDVREIVAQRIAQYCKERQE